MLCTVLYNNGTTQPLWQPHPETKQEFSSEQIDRERLESIVISGSHNKLLLVQRFEPGQRLILRRRIDYRVGIDPSTGEPWLPVVAILIGWYRIVGTERIQHVSVIFEDEHIENISNYQDEHHWFYSVREIPTDLQIIGEK